VGDGEGAGGPAGKGEGGDREVQEGEEGAGDQAA
jgi:hypothetical protein